MKLKMRFIFCSNVHVHDLRQSLIDKATETKSNFLLLNDVEKLIGMLLKTTLFMLQNLLWMLCNEESL